MGQKPTKAQRLRTLLSDGRWHSNAALVYAGIGFRYGSVIARVRHGEDGQPPMDIETRQVSPSRYEYRLRPVAAHG